MSDKYAAEHKAGFLTHADAFTPGKRGSVVNVRSSADDPAVKANPVTKDEQDAIAAVELADIAYRQAVSRLHRARASADASSEMVYRNGVPYFQSKRNTDDEAAATQAFQDASDTLSRARVKLTRLQQERSQRMRDWRIEHPEA